MTRPHCRDCGGWGGPDAARCPACGSPRLLAHPERDALSIAHVDCDAFYAAIEKRDDPALADRPVIVGGGRRGVVMTACYLARVSGVRSAMPMFKALRLCPDAVVVRPRMATYAEAGRAVRTMMLALTPLVEPLSIDEAFLDLAGTERVHGASPAVALARFARDVERQVGITVSIGLSHAKFLAKIASDLDKPRGFSIIGRAETEGFLAERPVTILPGVGAHARARLARVGAHAVGDILRIDPRRLRACVGEDADRLLALARGRDARPVRPAREAKGMSAETTFAQDIADLASLRRALWPLCERVSARLRRADLAGASVTLKLKDGSFRLRTRTRGGLPPTQLAERLFSEGEALLRGACDGTAYRLIGVGVGDLGPAEAADRGDLVDRSAPMAAAREAALQRVRARFGEGAIQRGLAFVPVTRE